MSEVALLDKTTTRATVNQLENQFSGEDMREVGAFEAKTKLAGLLDLVDAGEDVMITRHEKAVARLTAPDARFDRERAMGAAARIRARRKGVTLRNLTVRDLIKQGRR